MMHVGEKPYVVTASSSMNAYRGPLAWGQVELSSRVLTFDAVSSMLGQILPADQQLALTEFGAIEHDIPSPAGVADRFTVIAARGGEDVWVELRRRPIEIPQAQAPEADGRRGRSRGTRRRVACCRPLPTSNPWPNRPSSRLSRSNFTRSSSRSSPRPRLREQPAADIQLEAARIHRRRHSGTGRRRVRAQRRVRQRDSDHRRRAPGRAHGRGSGRDAGGDRDVSAGVRDRGRSRVGRGCADAGPSRTTTLTRRTKRTTTRLRLI